MNIVVFIVSIVCTNLPTSLGDTLKLLQMVHRHGDRTPIKTYPTDPYGDESYWPDGWGQLTLQGKNRMYQVGMFVRNHYKDFLGTSPRNVQIRSSAADRCLESVALVLAGCFPPEDRWRWEEKLGKVWQPFPIQTRPRIEDGMLNPGAHCPKAEEELKRIRGSKEVKDYTEQKKDLLKYVSDNTGLNVTEIITAEEVFDDLFIERHNNLKLPSWVQESDFNELQEVSAITFYFDFSTKLMQRLRAGLLIQDITKNMKEAAGLKSDQQQSHFLGEKITTVKPKFYIYSTHDSQLAVLLNGLEIFNMLAPPFGASLFFELREEQSDHFIRIYYLNETDSKVMHLLEIPGCSNNTEKKCHLDNFLHQIEELVPKDWRRECGFQELLPTDHQVVFTYLMIGSALTFSTMVFILSIYIYLKNKQVRVLYQMLPVEVG